MQPIPYGRQEITQKDIEAVSEVLRSDYLTQGPQIAQFEQAFAEYIGCKYAIAVANGTAALHLSALALSDRPGAKVITSPNTFVASSNCILYSGGQVDFADIDPSTGLINIEQVKTKLASAPRGTYQGIIPVDFAGHPVDLEAFRALADQYDLWLLEDACHAPGATFQDLSGNTRRSGDGHYADLAIFSFHPVKHIAAGEGGMITTNNQDLYEKLLVLRTHGITKSPDLLKENHGGWYYEMQELGFNYRLTDIQAALGLSQLSRAVENLKTRQEIAQRYDEAFVSVDEITIPSVAQNVSHAFHLYVIQSDQRKALYDYLRTHHIFAQVHYIPVHYQPYYQQLGWKKGDLPNAEYYYERCLSLPMYPSLTLSEQDYVIKTIKNFFSA